MDEEIWYVLSVAKLVALENGLVEHLAQVHDEEILFSLSMVVVPADVRLAVEVPLASVFLGSVFFQAVPTSRYLLQDVYEETLFLFLLAFLVELQ